MTERNSNPGTENKKSLSDYSIHSTASVLNETPAYRRLRACMEEGGCRVILISGLRVRFFFFIIIPAAIILVIDRLKKNSLKT